MRPWMPFETCVSPGSRLRVDWLPSTYHLPPMRRPLRAPSEPGLTGLLRGPGAPKNLEDSMNPATSPTLAPANLAKLPPYEPTSYFDFNQAEPRASFEKALEQVR